MKIFELFDRTYNYDWLKKDSEFWSADFFTDEYDVVDLEIELMNSYKRIDSDGEIIVDESPGWLVYFKRNGSTAISGKGDQFKIFATIIKMLKEFVDSVNPEKIYFVAEKNVLRTGTMDGRIRAYQAMLKRFATVNGYQFTQENMGYKATFKLEKIR